MFHHPMEEQYILSNFPLFHLKESPFTETIYTQPLLGVTINVVITSVQAFWVEL